MRLLLCASLLLSCLGPQAAAAAAPTFRGGARLGATPALASVPGGLVAPAAASAWAPGSLAASPLASAAPAAALLPGAAAASAAAAAPEKGERPALGGLEDAAAESAAQSADARGRGADGLPQRELFDGGESAAPAASAEQGPPSAARAAALEPASAGRAAARPSPAERADDAPVAAPAPIVPRSARVPVRVALVTGAGWLAIMAAWLALPASAPLAAAALISGAAAGALALTVGATDGPMLWALRRGQGVTNAGFWDFVDEEVQAGRIEANTAALIRPYAGSPWNASFAYTGQGGIWIRRELAASPSQFHKALRHQLAQLGDSGLSGDAGRWLASARARWSEQFGGAEPLRRRRFSTLERALREGQISLSRERGELLVLNPDTEELADGRVYEGLLGGGARPAPLVSADPLGELGARQGKAYQAIVLGGAAGLLPAGGSSESQRLESALQQLDSLFTLGARLVSRPEAFEPGSAHAKSYADLSERAQQLRLLEGKRKEQALKSFEAEIKKLWREIADTRLKGLKAPEAVDRLYGGLRDRGTAFLSFKAADRGVDAWTRLLRYWETPDGGRFRVTRVDLEDGSHMLMLRKIESRVGLWLRPIGGGRIESSQAKADESPAAAAAARGALEAAGFKPQLERFDALGLRVRHVFGSDTGRQEIYVTVPRGSVSALRRLVGAGGSAEVQASDSSFEPHLGETAGLHDATQLWRWGYTGKDGRVFWVDTGIDASHPGFEGRVDAVDMVNEGSEDWVGHGTHVAGISASGWPGFLGVARAARGMMAKVFSREAAGASDGEIMGSTVIALQKGFDVINLSLGSRGSSDDNLAEFMSQLTRQKNANGDYMIVVASAGNSGPFNRTLSQPGAGAEVISVAAAIKSLVDGLREIAFYSSVGPDQDRRFAIRRYRMKPNLAAIGGDVTTIKGSDNVYSDGTYSLKSKDAPPSPSDRAGGRETASSGTSMAAPVVAAAALLVKQLMRGLGAMTQHVADNLPFAVRVVLEASAEDLEDVVWFQGAGFIRLGRAAGLVAAAAGRRLGSSLLSWARSSPPAEGWGWVERARLVQEAEDRVFAAAEIARTQAQARFEDASESAEEPADSVEQGSVIRGEVRAKFVEARAQELPALLAALEDPVWLIRRNAAFALMNFAAPETAPLPEAARALAKAAIGDADARVRQMALLALGEMKTREVDEFLKRGLGDARWDVAIYSALALARHGDRSGAPRVARELESKDKRPRLAAAWVLGQFGSRATEAEAEALSARVKDAAERGVIRHRAAAALLELADAKPQTISDRVVLDLLESAGPDNLAVTRTLSRVFPEAVRDQDFVQRLRRDPLKSAVTDWVLRNKGALQKPRQGALAEMVKLLARAAAVPLDVPSAPIDPSGAAVRGIDPAAGPLDLLVPVAGLSAYADERDPAALEKALASAGLDAALLARFEASARAALPLAGAVWVSAPEHKVYALSLALKSKGLSLESSRPVAPLAHGPGEAPGFSLELGEGERRPEIPAGADLTLVRARASGGGVSEARVMRALEELASRADGRGVLSIALSTYSRGATALSRQLDAMAASGLGVVVGAGDWGPADGTALSPADAKLAVKVAAASAEGGLQFYSSRGWKRSPRITWTELVDHLEPGQGLADVSAALARALSGSLPARAPVAGTGAAAETAAAALAQGARRLFAAYSKQGRAPPKGWFRLVEAAALETLTPIPGLPHEVGAGLRVDERRFERALDRRLADLDAAERESERLAAAASGASGLPDADARTAAGRALKAATSMMPGPGAALAAEKAVELSQGAPQAPPAKAAAWQPAQGWDGWTKWLVSKAALPFAVLQLPQIYQNLGNQFPELVNGFLALIGSAGQGVVQALLGTFAGDYALIAGLPWLGYTTGVLGNLLMFNYLASKGERAGANVQMIGVIVSGIVLTQIWWAGFMPLWALAGLAALSLGGYLIGRGRMAGKVSDRAWKGWETLTAMLGSVVLPYSFWVTFSPFLPAALAGAVPVFLPSLIGGLIGGAMLALQASGRLRGRTEASWKFFTDWTPTFFFMFGPVAQIMTNLINPAAIAGLSVNTILLASAGLLLMLPRAMYESLGRKRWQDRAWVVGVLWGLLMGSWAVPLTMGSYMPAAAFWTLTVLIPAVAALSYVLSRRALAPGASR